MRQRYMAFLWNAKFSGLVTFLCVVSLAELSPAAASIAFVGAGALTDSSTPMTNVVIALPSGVQAGDCLIAQVVDSDATGSDVPSSPGGWMKSKSSPTSRQICRR